MVKCNVSRITDHASRFTYPKGAADRVGRGEGRDAVILQAISATGKSIQGVRRWRVNVSPIDEYGRRADEAHLLGLLVGLDFDDLDLGIHALLSHYLSQSLKGFVVRRAIFVV